METNHRKKSPNGRGSGTVRKYFAASAFAVVSVWCVTQGISQATATGPGKITVDATASIDCSTGEVSVNATGTGYAPLQLVNADVKVNGSVKATDNYDQADSMGNYPQAPTRGMPMTFTPASGVTSAVVEETQPGPGTTTVYGSKTVTWTACVTSSSSAPSGGGSTTTAPACVQTATATYDGTTLHVSGTICAAGNGTTYSPENQAKCDGTLANCTPQDEFMNVSVPAGTYNQYNGNFKLAHPSCGWYQWDFYTGPEQKKVGSGGTANYISGALVKGSKCVIESSSPPESSSHSSPPVSTPVSTPVTGSTHPSTPVSTPVAPSTPVTTGGISTTITTAYATTTPQRATGAATDMKGSGNNADIYFVAGGLLFIASVGLGGSAVARRRS